VSAILLLCIAHDPVSESGTSNDGSVSAIAIANLGSQSAADNGSYNRRCPRARLFDDGGVSWMME